jgi:hypothetical protein
VSEQRLESGEVALLGGREEACCQLVALLARGLEAGAALLDVASGTGRELAHVVLALADDPRDLRITSWSSSTARCSGERLSSSTSIASDSESAVSACGAGSSWPSVMIGSGSHSPT